MTIESTGTRTPDALKVIAEILAVATWREVEAFARDMRAATQYNSSQSAQEAVLQWAEGKLSDAAADQ